MKKHLSRRALAAQSMLTIGTALFSLCVALLWQPTASLAQPKWEKIIDNGDQGYSETGNSWKLWKIGNAYNGNYRYLSHHDQNRPRVGTATWQVKVPHTGIYDVHAHIKNTVNRTTNADYKFSDGNAKSHHVVLNQKTLPTGWHKIGSYYWKAGQVSKITLDGTDDNESDEADAMRWRYTGTGGPIKPPPVNNCTKQAPGTYTLKRFASQVTATGDWQSPSAAANTPDGKSATSPNVDAGEVLTASDFKLCTPPGTFRITAVKIGILAKMQYESGAYKLIMYLEGAGKRFPFSQTNLSWVYGDVTKAKASWTIADLNNLSLKAGLNSHPGGKRDSDAWVDAFTIEVTYEVTQSTTCPAGQTMCGGTCIDTQTNQQHCGLCDTACGGSEQCKAGKCTVQCPAGTTLCGAGLCADTTTNSAHCGGCNKICSTGQVCSSGACSTTCAAPTTRCEGQCIDTQADPNHCGGCNTSAQPSACKESEGCLAGQCQKSCAGGEVLCSKECKDPQTDTQHCGKCDNKCAPGESCQNGVCSQQVICQHRQLRCFDDCIDPQSDTNHCGTCGNKCQSWQACQAGECIGEPGNVTPPGETPTAPADAGSAQPDTLQWRTRRSCGCEAPAQQPALWLSLLFLGLLFRRKRQRPKSAAQE